MFDAVAKQNPAAAWLLSLLGFVNFEDRLISLFGGDDQDACADCLERITKEFEATGTAQRKRRSYLSEEGQWTLYDLESTLGTL